MKQHLFIKTLVVVVALAVLLPVSAQDNVVKCLQVVERDGTRTNFALSTKPQITIVDNELVFVSARETLTVPFGSFVEYLFVEGVPSKIDATQAEKKLDIAQGKVYITGLTPGAKVYVYTVAGQEVLAMAAPASGSLTIDLSPLAQGEVYILRTPTVSYKIMNK